MTTLPDLLAGSALDGTELLYAAQANADRKITARQIKDFIGTSGVSTAQFGAKGDNSTDDTAAIQAAIDYALANSMGAVYLPKGTYKITDSLYVDLPENLRAGGTGMSQFTLCLMGEPTGPSSEPNGARIKAYGDFPAVYVGQGRGMSLRSLKILRDSPNASRKSRASTSVGVALAANGSKFSMWDCYVYGFHTGIMTGYNGDPLTDSNSFFNCHVNDCYIGAHIAQTQNYINSFYDCTFEQCKFSVSSDVGKAVNIFGGNYSSYNMQRNTFAISSVSTLTAAPLTGSDYNYSFTATVASPDSYLAAGDYDAFCVKHDNWGLIPLTLVSYSAGTITLRFDVNWLCRTVGYTGDIKALSNIETDLQSCTTLYAAEKAVTFLGTGIHASGIHIENPVSVTTVLRYAAGFSGDACSTLENIYFNWAPTGSDFRDSTDDHIGLFYLQQVTPTIEQEATSGVVTCRNWMLPFNAVDPMLFVWKGGELKFESMKGLVNPTCWYYGNQPEMSGYGTDDMSHGTGFGHYDQTPFLPADNAQVSCWRKSSMGATPFIGYRHAFGQMPRITPTQLQAIIDNTVGAAGTYPPVSGDAIYQINDWTSGTPTHLFAKASHRGWSYGKDFAVDWSYAAGTNVVTVSAAGMFFNGLFIKLDNGSGAVEYVVTGVYPKLGYITVTKAADYGGYVLAGTKGTTYTGTTIGQSAITFTQF